MSQWKRYSWIFLLAVVFVLAACGGGSSGGLGVSSASARPASSSTHSPSSKPKVWVYCHNGVRVRYPGTCPPGDGEGGTGGVGGGTGGGTTGGGTGTGTPPVVTPPSNPPPPPPTPTQTCFDGTVIPVTQNCPSPPPPPGPQPETQTCWDGSIILVTEHCPTQPPPTTEPPPPVTPPVTPPPTWVVVPLNGASYARTTSNCKSFSAQMNYTIPDSGITLTSGTIYNVLLVWDGFALRYMPVGADVRYSDRKYRFIYAVYPLGGLPTDFTYIYDDCLEGLKKN